MREKTIKKHLVYDGRIIKVWRDDVMVGKKEKETIREVVHNDGGVCVLAFTQDQKLILIKQFRYPSCEILYELAGGKIDDGEDLLHAGIRELEEETGYVSEEVEYLGYLYPTVAYSDEVIQMIVAYNCVYKQKRLDEEEETDVVLLDVEDVLELIANNTIKDGKTIVAILKYLQCCQ